MRHHSCRPPPSPAVLTHPRPSSPVPGRPLPSIPLPCTNMSHPVGPVVLPKDGGPALKRPGRTTASRPVPSGALGSPPAGPRRAPGRLRTLPLQNQLEKAQRTIKYQERALCNTKLAISKLSKEKQSLASDLAKSLRESRAFRLRLTQLLKEAYDISKKSGDLVEKLTAEVKELGLE